jgi:hypothetical protein
MIAVPVNGLVIAVRRGRSRLRDHQLRNSEEGDLRARGPTANVGYAEIRMVS